MQGHDATQLSGSVVVVGLGNIGSFLMDHLARMPMVRRVVLIDGDRYEGDPAGPDPGRNFFSQCIRRRDLGQPKAIAQARYLKALRPDLDVLALADTAANVPLGRWRARVILAGLDSVAARLTVNEAAWRLGVPWVDAGIDPEGGLVRVHAYQPGSGNPCMACALEETDYQQWVTRHACAPEAASPTPTNGPTPLGGIAAGLLATECRKILAGADDRGLFGRQLILDTQHYRQYLTRFDANPACRFDHATWSIQPLPGLHRKSTLAELLDAGGRFFGGAAKVTVSLPGKAFARALACPNCGHQTPCFQWEGRIRPRSLVCRACRHPSLRATAFMCLTEIDPSLPRAVLGRTLAAAGLRGGDVLRFKHGSGCVCAEIPYEVL